jgi:FkbM family methyltransferase
LESLLKAHPEDRDLLNEYFEFLSELSKRSIGIMHALLPGVTHPLYFRCNTSDILNMKHMFAQREYDFPVKSPPKTILDIGAYCGYAAVFLSRRFPKARIFSVEPCSENFQILCANTLPYKNIRKVNAAVWSHATRMNLTDRISGHWGSIFGEGSGDGSVQAYSVAELLDMAGWSSADYIKIDAEGAEIEALSAPTATSWIPNAAVLTVETHDRFKPGCTDAVRAALPPTRFREGRVGEYLMFTNLERSTDGTDVEADSYLLEPGTDAHKQIEIVNVDNAPWAILLIDGETLQLHPNRPGALPAEARFPIKFKGPKSFATTSYLPENSKEHVRFAMKVTCLGRTLVEDEHLLAPGSSLDWDVRLPDTDEPCVLSLITELAPNAKTAQFAWARWQNPRIVQRCT